MPRKLGAASLLGPRLPSCKSIELIFDRSLNAINNPIFNSLGGHPLDSSGHSASDDDGSKHPSLDHDRPSFFLDKHRMGTNMRHDDVLEVLAQDFPTHLATIFVWVQIEFVPSSLIVFVIRRLVVAPTKIDRGKQLKAS